MTEDDACLARSPPLARRAPGQRIVRVLVQPANSPAIVSLLVDFETSPQKKLGRELFDREPDRVRRVSEPPVSNGPPAGSFVATGKQLRLSIIIKSSCGFDHYLFKHDFSDHGFSGARTLPRISGQV